MILTAAVWITSLVFQGYVSVQLAGFAFVVIIICLALGRSNGGNVGRLVRFFFRVGVPMASLLTVSVVLAGGNWGDLMGVLTGLLVLCLALVGLYIMFAELFSSFRRR